MHICTRKYRKCFTFVYVISNKKPNLVWNINSIQLAMQNVWDVLAFYQILLQLIFWWRISHILFKISNCSGQSLYSKCSSSLRASDCRYLYEVHTKNMSGNYRYLLRDHKNGFSDFVNDFKYFEHSSLCLLSLRGL